jgi:hypothetical protein
VQTMCMYLDETMLVHYTAHVYKDDVTLNLGRQDISGDKLKP